MSNTNLKEIILLQDPEEIYNDPNELEKTIQSFFQQFRVGKDQSLPKRNTSDMFKSHLKGHILKKVNLDITDTKIFPGFKRFYDGYCKTLKSAGKGNTKHNPEVPDESLAKIYSLLNTIHGLMLGDPNDPSYDELLSKIPNEKQENIHYLALYGAIMLITQYLAKRGREEIDQYRKTDFELLEDDQGNRYYKKIVGRNTKNHQKDSENVEETGGIIPFSPTPEGLSAGQYLHDFLEKLSPKSDFLCQRPCRKSKSFKIHKNPTCW